MAEGKAEPLTYLITGTSSGLGLDLVKFLSARGDKVFATVRKLASSATGKDLISAVEGDVTIITGVDVTDDNVGAVLKAALGDTKLDVVIHNAGSFNGTRDVGMKDLFPDQSLGLISMDRMRKARVSRHLSPA